jgi:hypothetical protein
MGILNWFFRSGPDFQKLPAGGFTVDRHGNVLSSTVGPAFSRRRLRDIGCEVLSLFRAARAAQMPLTGLDLNFSGLHITAQETQGGAVIFLSPQNSRLAAPSPAGKDRP